MSCTFLNETELYKCALILTNENIKTIKQFTNLKNAFLVIVNSKKAHLLHKNKDLHSYYLYKNCSTNNQH